MKNKSFKNFKLNQLQNIKQNYKYIYIFRYTDLSINEIILLKKKLKNFNYNSIVLKNNLIKKIYNSIKGQGPILIIYGNNNLNYNFIQILLNLKKIKLIYLLYNNGIYSYLKIKKITFNLSTSLNITIIKPIIIFLYNLKNLKTANIT